MVSCNYVWEVRVQRIVGLVVLWFSMVFETVGLLELGDCAGFLRFGWVIRFNS